MAGDGRGPRTKSALGTCQRMTLGRRGVGLPVRDCVGCSHWRAAGGNERHKHAEGGKADAGHGRSVGDGRSWRELRQKGDWRGAEDTVGRAGKQDGEPTAASLPLLR